MKEWGYFPVVVWCHVINLSSGNNASSQGD